MNSNNRFNFNPILQYQKEIDLISLNGYKTAAFVELYDVSSYPPFDGRNQITLKYGTTEITKPGFCYFYALQEIRKELSRSGLSPYVNGSSIDCYPSVMASDMGSGMKIYKNVIGHTSNSEDLVDTFDCNSILKITTVEEQDKFHKQWTQSVIK